MSDYVDYSEQYKYLEKCANEKGFKTAAALADEAGVDPAFLSRYKNGQIKNPSLMPFVKVYSAAEASLDIAFGLRTDSDTLDIENGELRHRIELLELELKEKNDKIAEQEATIEAERKVIFQRGKLITILTICLTVLILAIVGVTIYDRLNPYVGWFRY